MGKSVKDQLGDKEVQAGECNKVYLPGPLGRVGSHETESGPTFPVIGGTFVKLDAMLNTDRVYPSAVAKEAVAQVDTGTLTGCVSINAVSSYDRKMISVSHYVSRLEIRNKALYAELNVLGTCCGVLLADFLNNKAVTLYPTLQVFGTTELQPFPTWQKRLKMQTVTELKILHLDVIAMMDESVRQEYIVKYPKMDLEPCY